MKDCIDMEEDNKNVKICNNKSYESLRLDTDTSIIDFRSPEKKPIENIKLFNFKSTKCKKRQAQLKINLNNSRGYKAGTSKQVQDKISDDACIQTESNISCEQKDESKNLPNDTKVAYVCPLCFKNFKDNNSRILHMKNCAIKNKVSMKKLLQAMELQERQTAERVSLGLPGAPILQNKKQASVRRTAINGDSELQLAIVLSKSLYDVQEITNSSETEQDFLIACTKNPVENITSRLQKRKKQNIISILQTRQQEERDRLLTEKIAEIIMDSETLLRKQQQTKNEDKNTKKENLRSHVLKKLLNFDSKLWNAAMLQSRQTEFYVTDLSPYIILNKQKLENANESTIMNKSPQKESPVIKCDSYLNNEESSSISHKMDVKLLADMKKESIKQSSINTLITDWGNALNNSSSSDVIIFVNGGKLIWVHKLVFYVRCSNILLDIVPNENTTYSVKERICWTDIEYYIALAFLEFIYCGVIEKYPIFSNDSIAISSLGYLARRYKVKELFAYLRHKHAMFDNKTSKSHKFAIDAPDIKEICYSNNKQNKFVLTPKRDVNEVKCDNEDTFDITKMEVSHNHLLETNMVSPEKYTTLDLPIDREGSISPDIFDDIDDITLNHAENTKFIDIEHSKNIEYDLSSPNQCNVENITTNQLLFSSPINTNRSSTDECMLDKSIMVTPRINQIEQVLHTTMGNEKHKSDLTLFIEEVQKENAKSDFEIDSEIDSPSKLFIQHSRNPFRKTEYDESSIIYDGLDNFELSPTKARKKVSRLSKLESEMQIHAIENPQLYNITIGDNLKCTTPTKHNCTDLSLPIRESNVSVANNDKNSEKLIHRFEEKGKNVSMTTSYCSSSETDTDDADISMYTKYKRKHIDNSIALYRTGLKKHKNIITEIETDKRKNNEIATSDHASNFSNITTCVYSDIIHTTNDHVNISNTNMDESISISRVEENTSNLSFLRKSRNETEIFNTLVNNISQSTESFKNQKSDNRSNEKLIISCGNNSLKTQVTSNESFNDDCSSIFDLHSPELSDIEKQYSSPFKSPIYSNPILISSSPDIDVNKADNDDFSEYDNKHVLSSKTQKFDDELQHFFLNETSFSNVNIGNRITSVTSENNLLHISENNKKSRKRSKSEESLQFNYSVEEDYEISESNNTPVRRCNKHDNHESNVKNRLFTITESYNISPPNFNVMDTPALNREMKKYGLKTQNRKGAIKLLTYIYNELHPTITSYEALDASVKNIDIEDEELKRKRQKTDANLSQKYNIVNNECNMSPLKILDSNDYFKQTEAVAETNVSVENVIALNNCISINEAFIKLISFNEDLYNNILRYEPLNIEWLHSMLKTSGFKCKVNALIDFLDEQCITFYLPESKAKTRTKKVHT